MDHAKMEEIVQMLWMIITAVVPLDTRGRIVVLVSQLCSRFSQRHCIEQIYYSETENEFHALCIRFLLKVKIYNVKYIIRIFSSAYTHIQLTINHFLNLFLKISTIVLMGHAKIEETAQMLWMIITAAVSLDTRGRIVVLVRRTTLLLNEYSKMFTGNIRFLLRVNEQAGKFSTTCGIFENP